VQPSSENGIIFAGLMPHAPVLIPEVGQGREREARATVDAMRLLGERVVALKPDRLLLISPHTARRRGAFGVWTDSRIRGDLSRFGTLEVRIDLPNDQELGTMLNARDVPTWKIAGEALDHGASVPMYFLTRAGWDGLTTLVSLNYPGEGMLLELGEAIAQCVKDLPGKTVVIASGDMSHALIEGAPAGYHPRGAQFDRRFVDLVKARDYHALCGIEEELLQVAAEDVVDSTIIACAAAGWRNTGAEFLSYEGPFGVGYSVGILFDSSTHE
tara:strand:+ start:1054 stop:1866 length:813 start_codon:yes stop_codon:yes gene_type:complete